MRDTREGNTGASLKEQASTVVGMVALSGFVAVAACAAASISLWEVSGGLRQLRGGSGRHVVRRRAGAGVTP